MPFEVTEFLIQDIQKHIARDEQEQLLTLFEDVHFADVAEILEDIDWDEARNGYR